MAVEERGKICQK